jgi:hypothetical protein
MRLITSLSAHRIERQQYCLETWAKHGEIVCVQTEAEIDQIAPHFQNVQFVTTDKTGEIPYGYSKRVRISALVEQGPGLLLNSDIKITSTASEFKEDWKANKGEFRVGIRQDFDGPGRPKLLNRYGIDAFLITDDVMRLLPDYGFVIGVSVWDYWIVWHMLTERFAVKTIKRGLLHLRHPINWSDRDTEIGMAIMAKHYQVSKPILDIAIPALTDRVRVRN